MRTRDALRRALIAALAVPASACNSSDEACVVVGPEASPPWPTLDGSSGCAQTTYEVTIANLDSCSPDANACAVACGTPRCTQAGNVFTCTLVVCGKARASLRRRRRRGGLDPFREYLRTSAWLEAASIGAFYTLARELQTHGAPSTLVAEARAAARDERRHARAMAALARRFGVTTRSPRERHHHVRPLLAIAVENAQEGLVHETFGACIAAFQAERAPDPFVRRSMRAIAVDEARHAALARRIARWADALLTPAQRARVARAREAAIARLELSLRNAPPAALVATLAVPTSAQSLAITSTLRSSLWND